MKIPITYLILAIIVIVTLVIGQGQFKKIADEAQKKSKTQEAKSLELFQIHSKKITSANVAMKRGITYLRNDDTQKAVAILEQAIKLDNTYRDPNFYLGYAYLKDIQLRQKDMSSQQKKGELGKAKQSLISAQKIDPLYPMTNKLLGIIGQIENNDNEKRLWYARYNVVTGNINVAGRADSE